MIRMSLGLEYDGSQFHGWQSQTSLPTVQGALEAALSQVAGQPILTICAGRTDAGVHAKGQVVHFDTPVIRNPKAWVFGANTVLPPAVRVLWAHPVSQTFNARRSALKRQYRYEIYNHPIRPSLLRQYVTWYYRKLDISPMIEASQHWLGEHDFSAFRAAECQSRSPIRRIDTIQIVQMDNHISIEIVGNAFLHHMVRNMVGVLIKIGIHGAPPIWAKEVLESRDRKLAGVTAPPQGLCLMDIEYPAHFGLPKIDLDPWILK